MNLFTRPFAAGAQRGE